MAIRSLVLFDRVVQNIDILVSRRPARVAIDKLKSCTYYFLELGDVTLFIYCTTKVLVTYGILIIRFANDSISI